MNKQMAIARSLNDMLNDLLPRIEKIRLSKLLVKENFCKD